MNEKRERKKEKKNEEIRRKQEKEREEERKIADEIRRKQERIEEEEFALLVAEMASKNFTLSAQVSYYIIKNRLGEKYQNISGILEMENGHSSWKFNGGFPPKIYAKLCDRLNLGNKGTESRVTGFTSFKDLK